MTKMACSSIIGNSKADLITKIVCENAQPTKDFCDQKKRDLFHLFFLSNLQGILNRVLTDLPPSGSSIDPASVAV